MAKGGMGTVQSWVRLAVSCSLIFTLLGCVHNPAEVVREGNPPSFWWSNAYLLVGVGGNADGEAPERVSHLWQIYQDARGFSFSEYDPAHPTGDPSCMSVTWSEGGFNVPLTAEV